MRRAALIALLLLGGCGGGSEPEQDEAATLVVTVNTRGALSTETFAVERGRMRPAPVSDAYVYARAGDEEPEEGISYMEVYLVDPGEEPQRLTHDRRFDHSPALLGDGRVAFVSCPMPSGPALPDCSLDAIEPESGERQTVAGDLGFVWAADLAPDERRLLLARAGATADPTDLIVRDLDSREEERLGEAGFARWSPDGERIAFSSDRDRNGRCLFHDCTGFAGEIYVMDADGGDPRRLTEDPGHDAGAEWSGDGEWILFGRIPDEESDWDLYAVRANGDCEVQLTDTDRWETGAEWHGAGDGGLSC